MIDNPDGTQSPQPDNTKIVLNGTGATFITNPTNGPNGQKTDPGKPGNSISTLI